jgi:beta-ureidopropionase / N-carbamoyl-L-amino-acid hydrolase
MQIRPERLLADLRELATIGAFETGVNRPAFSAEDSAGREWLRARMAAAGLDATIDSVGNVYGRMPNVERAVLIGSHSDTVPYGGWLDGSLGVIYALEVARAVAESGTPSGVGVDVISFQDEEGTFLALLGSRSFCGEAIGADVGAARSKDGRALADILADSKFRGQQPARLDRRRHLAFLEAHIEQGPRLERSGQKIGIVSAIVGIRTLRVVFHGQADHAGTTPMSMRRDAGAAALAFGALLSERLAAYGSPDAVWNVGSASFKPGASNVVPSEAELILQFRDASEDSLVVMERMVHDAAAECARRFNAEAEIARVLQTRPAAMDPHLAGLIERAASELGAAAARMPSGAGHDAMVMARHLPAAMLFVPSIGGRSHHVSENTSDEDIVLGARVLLRAAEHLLRDSGARS